MKVKPPTIVKDLYLDLRDRRLLPIVILLLVALVAIPILLGGESETVPPPDPGVSSAAANDAESVAQLTPFVTNEVPGIREFDERLDSFKRRNPFRQQLTGPPKAAQRAIDELEKAAQRLQPPNSSGGSDAGASTSGSPSTSGSSTAGSGGSSDSGSGGSTGGDSGGGSGGSGGGGSGGGGSGGGSEEVVIYSWKIDAKVGPVGDAKKVKNVKSFEFLPGKKRPIVQFVRGDFDGKAVFVVSRNVDLTSGDGRCHPNRKSCQFLMMKEGEEHRFEYAPENRTYRLKLTKVELVEKRVDPSKLSAKQLYKQASAYGDLIDTIRGR